MTKQQIYDSVVELTAEIKVTEAGAKLLKAANKSGKKASKVCEEFITQYPKLYLKMQHFATKLTEIIKERYKITNVKQSNIKLK